MGSLTLRERWMLLLGINTNISPKFFPPVGDDYRKLHDIRVVEQDANRTRQSDAFFSTDHMHTIIFEILCRFCFYHNFRYMQGLNEILAPFLSLSPLYEQFCQDSISTECNRVALSDFQAEISLFEEFVTRYCSSLIQCKGIQVLQAQLSGLHQLLYYFDPLLSYHLSRLNISTDMYAVPWLITLFSRRQSYDFVFYLWEKYLYLDDVGLIVFLCVALLEFRKDEILTLDSEEITQYVVKMNFRNRDEINSVFEIAKSLRKRCPCSSLQEIREVGFDKSLTDYERMIGALNLMVNFSYFCSTSFFLILTLWTTCFMICCSIGHVCLFVRVICFKTLHFNV